MHLIREATMGDNVMLRKLSEQLGYRTSEKELMKNLSYLLQKPTYKIYIAVENEKIVGYISMDEYDTLYMPSGLNITALVVDKDFRGQGVGTVLLQTAEKYALSRSLSFVRINSGSQRVDAHKFYRKRGYVVEKDQKRFLKYIGGEKS
jgi:GNAT superfamily N-acetyltransferase